MTVVVVEVAKAMVAECVAAVTFPEESDKTEEGKGAADEFRQLLTVLKYWIQLLLLQPMNGPD